MADTPNLRESFGLIDIYLFDQLLRGRIQHGMSIFDAGFGSGRNLVYFLREGFEISGVDSDPIAVQQVQRLAGSLSPNLPSENFRCESIEGNSFPNSSADVVIASAILHFARDDAQFMAMLAGLWRVLKPGGLLFCRLASSIGMENQFPVAAGRRFRLPDGSTRYLVDELLLVNLTRQLGGELADPLKTTIVQNQRCMTTWVVHKHA